MYKGNLHHLPIIALHSVLNVGYYTTDLSKSRKYRCAYQAVLCIFIFLKNQTDSETRWIKIEKILNYSVLFV